MAITKIKGTVSRTFHNGCGAEITETFTKRNGEEGKSRWTCWFDSAHGLSEGDQVAVSGMHGDQVDEWTDKQGVLRYSVKRSINGAKTQVAHNGPTSSPKPVSEPWATGTRTATTSPQTGAQDNWATSADDTETPF
jgi:hypothetical protein